MAYEFHYRVLVNGEITARLPLVSEVEGFDCSPQEYCGTGFEGDFTDAEDNGRGGEVWEFVAYSATAMEQALDSDPAVIAYKQLG